MLGGFTYRYSMRDQVMPEPVSSEQQRQALHALLSTLDPVVLNPGNHVLELMSPRPSSYPATPESFSGSTGVIFDAVRPIENAASITMQEILKPTRAALLAQSSTRNPKAPGLKEVLNAIVDYTWKGPRLDGDVGVAQRAIAIVVVQSLLAAIGQQDSTSAVRGTCWLILDGLQEWMNAHPPAADWEETYAFVAHAVKQDPTSFRQVRSRSRRSTPCEHARRALYRYLGADSSLGHTPPNCWGEKAFPALAVVVGLPATSPDLVLRTAPRAAGEIRRGRLARPQDPARLL